MILDAQNQLSDSQVFTTNTTTVTTNAIDLGNVTPKRTIGDGEPMAIAYFIEAVTGAADTFTFNLISSTASTLGSGVLVHARTRVLTAADIPVGSIVALPIPPGTPTQRYLGGSAILGASDALTASAFILPLSFLSKLRDYASGIVIL